MTETSTEGITYVRTADIPLDELTPFPGNAKRGDVDVIRASLRRNGQYRSLVVREIPDGPLVVLAGNHTMQALAAEKEATARCEVILCDDATARRINLVDNRTSELGGYDNDALAELLSYTDGDYDGTGYTDDDVMRLITPATPPVEDEWGDAFDKVPDGEQQHGKRTFIFTVEQAALVDRAIEAAQTTGDADTPNSSGAALTIICEAYIRSVI